MEHNLTPATPGASTDERASSANPHGEGPAPSPFEPGPPDAMGHPTFASEEAARLYWRAYRDGIRAAGREPGHPHMPADFSIDLTRDGASGGLVSGKLLEARPENPHDAPVRTPRADGWNTEREQAFVRVLAGTGVVADACRAVGISRTAAYEHRHRAGSRAFALAWDAARLVARTPLADDAYSRARHGCIERVYRNGELVAERHRYDNRLTMAVLTRLDRLAEGMGENAPVIRAVAAEFDQFVANLGGGIDAAEAFLAVRFPGEPANAATGVTEPVSFGGARAPAGSEQALLARLAAYRRYGCALPLEAPIGDLDPSEMERWTDEQLERAEFSGFLDIIPSEEWPEAVRAPDSEGPDGTDGMCKLRQLYRRRFRDRFAPAPRQQAEKEDDFEGFGVWEGEDGWRTDFPPPDGFDGWEEGDPESDMYRRELTAAEFAVIAPQLEREEAEEAARRAAAHAARDRFFGFAPSAPPPGAADGTKPH